MSKPKGTSKAETKVKNLKMVKAIMNGVPQGKAYAESRNRPYRPEFDSGLAWKALTKPEVQAMMEKMQHKYLMDAGKAYEKGWEVAGDEMTPPQTKIKWYEGVLDRAMPAQPSLNLHKHEHIYPEFMKSKQEIIEMMEEPETADEISKRNRYE